MKVNDILARYEPGDNDDWSVEFAQLLIEDGNTLGELVWEIDFTGIKEPILLGDDGRVWDGHHRLMVARILGIEEVEVKHGTGGRKP